MKLRFRTSCSLPVFALASLICSLLVTDAARAGNRIFLVTLANSPKHYAWNDGLPPEGLTSKQVISNAYFLKNPNDGVGSFAEYWEEVSYGDVTITGQTTDWISLPWPFQPLLADPDSIAEDGPTDAAARISPESYMDMNRDGQYSYGQSEEFQNLYAMVVIDTNGDYLGQDDGPYGAEEGTGSADITMIGAKDVWKPGERFLDLDGDGKWDGLDENKNWMDYHTTDESGGLIARFVPDGRPDNLGPWVDLNGDKQPQAPQGCIYLPDSDNDGWPDCCPNGPGMGVGFWGCNGLMEENPCPPTQWSSPQGDVIDCNGNLLNDEDEINDGISMDNLPSVPMDTDGDGTEECVEGEGDDIPDICQYQLYDQDGDPLFPCRAPGAADPENPCVSLPECIPLEELPVPQQRCEYDYLANNSGVFDIVEPFENFLRRWDPCYFDPDASAELVQTERIHWIKVYDPFSDGVPTCEDPPPMGSAFAYSDSTLFSPLDPPMFEQAAPSGIPSYIQNNYPGDFRELEREARGRPVYGSHDPLNKLPPVGDGRCVCLYDCEGNFMFDPDTGEQLFYNCIDADLNGDGIIDDATEMNLCCAGIHADYNPPDKWIEAAPVQLPDGTTIRTTKMRAAPGTNFRMEYATATPEPGAPGAEDQEPWFDAAWQHRYGIFSDDYPSPTPTWPTGFDPSLPPVPGVPQGVQPNTPRFEPWDQLDPTTYNPAQDRRYFNANFGGINGRGRGWTGFDLEFLKWETGLVGTESFEGSMNAAILPEEVAGEGNPGIFFDGWVEHDDLPSSKYHLAGDQWLGELTSPWLTWVDESNVPQIWGHDIGTGQLGSVGPGGPDQITPAAGPYATGIHGTLGRDGGNQLLIEYLTWRTDGSSPTYGYIWEWYHGIRHPYAGPGMALLPNAFLGFRDYNLDGMIDQGEVAPAGAANYLADPINGTPNNGVETVYPFNRRRLVEDCIEILDEVLDFNDLVDPVSMARLACPAGTTLSQRVPLQFGFNPSSQSGLHTVEFNGVVSGIVLLPEGTAAPSDDLTENEFNRSPGFYPIHNEDSNDTQDMFPPGEDFGVTWNLAFHDLVYYLGGEGEAPGGIQETGAYQTAFSAHEYFHAWEDYPDLYDYDVWGPPGSLINCPIGVFDIMAHGGLVHPVPILKEKPCTEWISPTDLTTVVTPGVPATITLPRAEFVRDNSYYFVENECIDGVCAPGDVCSGGPFDGEPCDYGSENADAPCKCGGGERFYFWSAGAGDFDGAFPGEGMLILHTDTGSDPNALPPQQLTGTRFTYKIVQADGLDELTGGPTVDPACGDAGDLWPGTTGATEFDFYTNPPARWYAQNSWTGLKITDIRPDGTGSIAVDLTWQPVRIPSLSFVRPPGGGSVGSVYSVKVDATDLYGGTLVRFFYTDEPEDFSIPAVALHEPITSADFTQLDVPVMPGDTLRILEADNVNTGDYAVRRIGARRLVLATDPREDSGPYEVTSYEVRRGSTVLYARPSASGLPKAIIADNHIGDVQKEAPYTFQISRSWNIAGVPDGRYYLFAQLIPGEGEAGVEEPATDPRPGRNNEGNGTLDILSVDIASPYEFGPAIKVQSAPGEGGWASEVALHEPLTSADFTQLGVTAGDTLRILDAADSITTGDYVIWRIDGQNLALASGADPRDGSGPYEITDYQIRRGSTVLYDRSGGGALPEATLVEFPGFLAGSQLDFENEGVVPSDRLFIVPVSGTTSIVGVIQSIEGDPNTPNDMRTLRLSSTLFPDGQTYAVKSWQVRTMGGARLETWIATCVDIVGSEQDGFENDFIVYGTLTQPEPPDDAEDQDPYPHLLVDRTAGASATYTTIGGEVAFKITQGADLFEIGDSFTFSTTGITAMSKAVAIVNGHINEGPTAIISASPLEGRAPLTVTFDARDSFDPNGDPLTFLWQFDDGSPPASGPVVAHTFTQSRTFSVLLRATNPRTGLFDEAFVDIIIANNSPKAVMTATPTSGPTPLTVTFDGSQSSDTETPNNELIYEWDFGDPPPAGSGEPGEYMTVQHFYRNNGMYTAKLTVTDEGGKQDITTVDILVGNTRPVPIIFYTALQGPAEHEVVFNAIASYDEEDSNNPDIDPTEVLEVTWRWDDGSPEETWPIRGANGATDGSVPHIFKEVGSYHVTATIFDSQDASTDWPGVTVVVREFLPGESDPKAIFCRRIGNECVPIEDNPPLINEEFTVDAFLSYDLPTEDPNSKISRYLWNFGDGTTAQGVMATHTYTAAGTYTIRLIVEDNESPRNTGTISRTFTVREEGTGPGPGEVNHPPTAVIIANPLTGIAGETEIRFDASTSTDEDQGDQAQLTYSWSFGDGTTAQGVFVEHTYDQPGLYRVRLTVTDPQNGSSTATQQIDIRVLTENRDPLAFITTGIRSTTEGGTLRFNGSTSFDPDGDVIAEYRWVIKQDNGEMIDELAGVEVERAFMEAGNFTVQLIVTDEHGAVGESQIETIIVTARATLDNENDNFEPPPPNPIPPSEGQRPGLCGFGMLQSVFGMLLCLTAMAAGRRRQRL